MRGFAAAAVCAIAVAAGIIASSSGRDTLTPRPRNTVRRDRCFLVMNIFIYLCVSACVTRLSPAGTSGRRRSRKASLFTMPFTSASNR